MQIEFLGERYQLQDPIGRGGMATIYRGLDMRMERVVAIKVLREVYSTDPKFVTRFQREAKAASALQHPNIVQVFDYGQSDGNYYIVMELIEGTDLRRYLRSRGVLAIDRAIIIAHDVALGLGAAHRRGIVHRDVKPQNVLVGRDGSIKLTDFGIASVYKDINAERLTTTGMTLGTVQYYAPEQAQGEIVTPAADVYALGIVMYEMLTGRTPFDGDTPVAVAMQHIQDAPIPPSQYNPNIPPALEEIILRCMEKVPEMRYRDGSALARALELLGENEGGGNTLLPLPGGPQPGINGQTLNMIPPRPGGGVRVDGQQGYGEAARTVSSPNHLMAPPISQNDVQDDAASATIVGPVGGLSGAAWPEAPFAAVPSNPGGPSLPGYGSNQGAYNPYNAPADGVEGAGATRGFPRGTVPRAAVQNRREPRFASIITILILFATLLLLGFSIYLAIELKIIPTPWFPAATTTATPSARVHAVPDLVGLSLKAAQTNAASSGFTVKVVSGLGGGNRKVINQSPPANASTTTTVIYVNLGPDTATPGPTIPDGLAGKPLAVVKNALTHVGITHYKLSDVGPNTSLPQDTVQGTDPPGGVSVPLTQTVTIYVWNCTACGTATPIPTTGITPTVGITPTSVPPTPTPVPPTPDPTSSSTPDPTPSSTPITPTPDPTASTK